MFPSVRFHVDTGIDNQCFLGCLEINAICKEMFIAHLLLYFTTSFYLLCRENGKMIWKSKWLWTSAGKWRGLFSSDYLVWIICKILSCIYLGINLNKRPIVDMIYIKRKIWQINSVRLPTTCHNFTLSFEIFNKFHWILPKFFSDMKIGYIMHVCQ